MHACSYTKTTTPKIQHTNLNSTRIEANSAEPDLHFHHTASASKMDKQDSSMIVILLRGSQRDHTPALYQFYESINVGLIVNSRTWSLELEGRFIASNYQGDASPLTPTPKW
jgi:hypothetical protein